MLKALAVHYVSEPSALRLTYPCFFMLPPADPGEAVSEKVHQHAIAYNRDEF